MVVAEMEALSKLNKDVRAGVLTLGKDEARFLVDYYYQMQDDRITTDNRIRSIIQSGNEEPHEVISFIGTQVSSIEENIKKILDIYTLNHPVGQWLRSITGVGPVIAAGLIANLDIKDRPVAGHFWSYGGLNDNNRPWLGIAKVTSIVNALLNDKKSKDITYEDFCLCCAKTQWKPENIINAKGKDNKFIFLKEKDGNLVYNFKKEDIIKQCSKRPYNQKLKTLLWKLSESFIKVSNNPTDFYGKIYQQRKAYETVKNENLEYKEQALKRMTEVGKTTEAYKWYSKGMLPPKHINMRAQRYTEKIFLSHLHEVMYIIEYGEMPPKPFAMAILGHAHKIECPNIEIIKEKFLK